MLKLSSVSLPGSVHAPLQRLVSTFVMRMFDRLTLNDAQHFVGDVSCSALVGQAQRALPDNPIRSFLQPVVDEAVVSQDVQLHSQLDRLNLNRRLAV